MSGQSQNTKEEGQTEENQPQLTQPKESEHPAIMEVLNEISQTYNLRKGLLEEWAKTRDRNVITFFTSFTHPAGMITDQDRDIIEDILSKMDYEKGLDLIINSPGGLPLAAERIINVCRTYSSNFQVIIPKLAKSAATMIAFGANNILIGETAELGPVDPQIVYTDQRGQAVIRSAYAIINGVEEILKKIGSTSGRIEGLLYLLPPIDQPFIEEVKRSQKLSENIATKWLAKTTFSELPEYKGLKDAGEKESWIKKRIELFINPEKTYSHGRPITYEDAKKMQLKVDLIKKEDSLWNLLLKIYTRSDFVVSNPNIPIVKLIESPTHSFSASASPLQQKKG